MEIHTSQYAMISGMLLKPRLFVIILDIILQVCSVKHNDVQSNYNAIAIAIIDNVPVRNAAMIYGSGDVMIQLDNLACRGDELSLLSCSRHSINQHACDSSDVAGVKCGGNECNSFPCFWPMTCICYVRKLYGRKHPAGCRKLC